MHSAYIPVSVKKHANRRTGLSDLFEEIFRMAVGREAVDPARIGLVDRQLVDLSPEAIVVYRHNKFTLLNQAASRLLGARDANELIGKNIFDFIHPNYHGLFHKQAGMPATSAASTPFVEQIWNRLDGTQFDAEIAATNLSYNGSPAVQVVVRDITERKRAEELQLGQTRILNMIATGIALPEILTEIAQFIDMQTGAFCAAMLLDAEGTTLSFGAAPSLSTRFKNQFGEIEAGPRSASCGTAVFRGEPLVVTDIAKDPVWADKRELALKHGFKACSSWPIVGKNGKMLGTLALYFRRPTTPTAKDMELLSVCTNLAGVAIESRTSEEKIRYLAHYDGLTSLPNRFLFNEYLDLALRNAQRHRKKFAVFFLDLDKFKDINDTFGHEAGDQVLREIATRLRGCLRSSDKIARIGGDEFTVLIEDLGDGGYAAHIAEKLLAEASRSIFVGQQECRLSGSIGVAVYPDDGSDGKTLLKNADHAMYRVKDFGKNNYSFYAGDNTLAQPTTKHLLQRQGNKEIR